MLISFAFLVGIGLGYLHREIIELKERLKNVKLMKPVSPKSTIVEELTLEEQVKQEHEKMLKELNDL